jgi:hypothetical protein
MDYISMTRSNYFTVRDEETFCSWLNKVWEYAQVRKPEVVDNTRDTANVVTVMYEGSIPSEYYDEDREEEVEFDFLTDIAGFLADGEVAVFITIGYEGMRYLHGDAFAVHSDGRFLIQTTGQIYELAEKEWGITPQYAEY